MEYTIIEHLGDLCRENNGWIKELNFISWNNREPVYDIRAWHPDHTRYGKGVTLTCGEIQVLQDLIRDKKLF